MSKHYAGRHRDAARAETRASRHATARRPSLVVRALRRPAVTTALGLAVVATTAAGYQAGDAYRTAQAGFTVSAQAVEQAGELSDLQIENDAQLASARSDANLSTAAAQEKARRDQVAAEEAAARARKEAAERAAREKERKALEAKREAVIARAKDDPRSVARLLLPEHGWDDSQFSCLDQLWEGESNWNYRAENPSSGAYGIPQSLPGSKMGTIAPDWRENPVTQITWGLQYIESSYGSPCNAWAQWQSRSPHWY
ncbi:MAG TPA: hypothetical protein VH915_10645 [Pedococcus sp.]